jgi:pimeloyl-ACP methyl ester carboxylesterase
VSCFVLVHGSWGGGWIWSRLASQLRANGHSVHAPSLTGLADRGHLLSAEVDLSTHIDDVANLIEFERLEDVVLVGHSYGGMVTTGVLGRHPGRVDRMVYLDAYLPEPGESCLDILPAFREPLDEMAANHGGLYLEPMDPVAFGVDDEHEARWIHERSTLMPYAPIKQPLPEPNHPAAATEKPSTFVLCRKTGGLFAETAARAQARGCDVRELDTHHFAQVSVPDEIASLLQPAPV